MRTPQSIIAVVFICLLPLNISISAESETIFAEQQFTQSDALLVISDDGQVVYDWRSEQPMIPASLVKLLTSYLAIEKWGLQHRFKTEFYTTESQLWIKGYGDPYLVSEEIDRIVEMLKSTYDLSSVESVHIDIDYFENEAIPGRSSVADPYNAPLSAIAANFNTVYLQKLGGEIVSAEAQTPLTNTAVKLAGINQQLLATEKKSRVNLINVDNAQLNFAELLIIKLGLDKPTIKINQQLPEQAKLLYRHLNSQTLESVLIGVMKYSNNFIANQLYLKLAENQSQQTLGFGLARSVVDKQLSETFSWHNVNIVEGAGLSRQNALSAKQIDELLVKLKPHKNVLKHVVLGLSNEVEVNAFVKTGTLNGVSNYAGYIDLPDQEYRFVFMFNRATTYGFRDLMLKTLAQQLLMKKRS